MLGFLKAGTHAPTLPTVLGERLTGANVILLADRVGVVTHLSGHLPGVFSSCSAARSRGAFVVTTTHVIATFATRSDPHVLAFDSQWDCARGPAVMTLGAHGLQIDVALHGVDPACSGSMTLTYKRNLTEEVLALLPAIRLQGSVDPRSMYLAAGVRPRS
jgi:hypothetical protein